MFVGGNKELATGTTEWENTEWSVSCTSRIRALPEWIKGRIRGMFGRRNCVIIGGASGIGAEYTKAYAAQNYRVAFMDIDKDAGKELKKSLEQKYGKKFFFFHGDAYCEADVDIFVKAVGHQFGRINSFYYNLWNWPYRSMVNCLLTDKATVACIYRRPDQMYKKCN